MILDHVCGEFRNAVVDGTPLGVANEAHVPVILLLNLLSKFAVPCFVMLSGAFLLADSRNRQFRYFYRKEFENIGVPTIVFSLLYLLYSEAEKIAKIALGRCGIGELLGPVLELLKGEPLYHMWYLYAMAGVYLLVPIIIRLKDEIGEQRFAKVSWLFLLFAVPSGWTSTFILSWGPAKSICYVGYLLVGYQLRRCIGQKNNIKGVLLIAGGLICEAVVTLVHAQSLLKRDEIGSILSFSGNFSPLIVLASLMIFAGFSRLRFRRRKAIDSVAARSFYIYLLHAGVWDVICLMLFRDSGPRMALTVNGCVVIPIAVPVVFVCAYLCSGVWRRLWSVIDKDDRVTARMSALFGLR